LCGAEVADEPFLLVEIYGRAFVVVVADVVIEAHGGLGDGQQALGHARDCHAGARVGVYHAGHVRAGAVDGAVDDVAGMVVAVVGVRLPDDGAVEVDFDQAGSGHLLVHKAVEVDEQVVLLAGNAGRDVVVDEVGHFEAVDQPVTGGEVDARVPFGLADVILDAAEVGGVAHYSTPGGTPALSLI
jgi:hypothetical protein